MAQSTLSDLEMERLLSGDDSRRMTKQPTSSRS